MKKEYKQAFEPLEVKADKFVEEIKKALPGKPLDPALQRLLRAVYSAGGVAGVMAIDAQANLFKETLDGDVLDLSFAWREEVRELGERIRAKLTEEESHAE